MLHLPIKAALAVYLALKRHRGAAAYIREMGEFFLGGEMVPRAAVEGMLGDFDEAMAQQVEWLTWDMINENIELDDWQDDMRYIIVDSWRVHYIAGRGGVDWMSHNDWGRVGGQVGFQIDRLNNFAREIFDKKLSIPQIHARAKQYVRATWQAYQSGLRAAKQAAGYTHEWRKAMMDENTCADCAEYHERGWVPIGTLPPPGSGCQCGANCRCEFDYKGKGEAPEMAESDVYEILTQAAAGGFTYHPVTAQFPTEGFVLSQWEERTQWIPGDSVSAEAVWDFVAKNRDLIIDQNQYLGGWMAHGQLCLDVSAVYGRDQFDNVVLLANRYHQDAFYSLHEGKEYNTAEEYQKILDRMERKTMATQKKKKVALTLVRGDQMPDPDKDPAGFADFAKTFVNQVRANAGLPPAYDEDGNEIPGRIKRKNINIVKK